MKEDLKSEQNSDKSSSSSNYSSQHSQENSKNDSSKSQESPESSDENKKEGDEFIREGHGHDYSVPFAGEDGGTEEQPEGRSENNTQKTDKNKPAEQGKTPGENSTI
jgi:hypothetical protein